MGYGRLLVSTLLVLTGCKELSLDGDSGASKACTAMGSNTSIRVLVTSATPLPLNLGIALNGTTLDADECAGVNPGFSSQISISANRMQAEVIFALDFNKEDYEFYFPYGSERPPTSDQADFGFYGRVSCSDPSIKFTEVVGTKLSWKPIYANGSDCGASSHSATANVQF